MGLYVQQNNSRTELQERIAAELREKAQKSSTGNGAPDLVDDVKYVHGTKRTTTLAFAWVAIVLIVIALIVTYAVVFAVEGRLA